MNTTNPTYDTVFEILAENECIAQLFRQNRYSSKLDKLLIALERSDFMDADKITEKYKHRANEDAVKIVNNILHQSGNSSESRKLIETEREAWRTVNGFCEMRNGELVNILDEKKNALAEKDKLIAEKYKLIDEKDKLIAELKRKLKEK